MMALAGLTALFAVPEIALFALLLSFGLAIPLVLAFTGFLYGLCLFPLFVAWELGGGRRMAGVGISAALLLALADLPARISKRQASLAAAAIASTDVPASQVSAHTLEIRRNASNPDRFFADSAICGLECRSLLLGDSMRWVRIVVTDQGSAKSAESVSFFEPARGMECAVPNSPKSGDGACVLIKPDKAEGAELVVSIESGSTRGLSGAIDTIYYLWKGWSRVTAASRSGGQEQIVYRHSWARLASPFRPFVVQPSMDGMHSSGYEIGRATKANGATSLSAVLAEIGLPIPRIPEAAPAKDEPKSWKDGISDEMTRQLIAVLDLPGKEVFNREQSAVISRWVTHARTIKQWTPDLIELLRRITLDKRLRSPTFVDQIIERNHDVAMALLPDALAVMQEEGLGSDFTVARRIAYIMPRLDQKLLLPHAQDIIALLHRDPRTREILLPAIGRIGIDPTPYLVPFSADLKSKQWLPRIRGACYANPRWHTSLVPRLRTALSTKIEGEALKRARDYRLAILQTLAKLGDDAFVQQAAATRAYPEASRAWKKIEQARKSSRANRLCSF
jgi:hypothetical protein